jgi:Thymidylate synthase complementing protein
MYNVKVICDSIGPHVIRLTTFEATYPLIIHNELMTHRMLSRCTASNRAIPVTKMIDAVLENPFIPEQWPKNQKGMQAQEYLTSEAEIGMARSDWLWARDQAVHAARRMLDRKVHKQITNRLLAPWLFTTCVISATDWANFFALRCHPDAQPEMAKLAYMMQYAYYNSRPKRLEPGQWHTPYLPSFHGQTCDSDESGEGGAIIYPLLISAGRCARVSYLRQGEANDADQDAALAERLSSNVPPHMSPFEHVAQCGSNPVYIGNFRGYLQLRKCFANERATEFKPNHAKLITEANQQRAVLYPINDEGGPTNA